MKTLVIVAHPGITEPVYGAVSRLNNALLSGIKGKSDITVVDLTKDYNIQEHHKLMEQHERIVLQFPVFWFNMPGLAKKWLDDVLVHNWAYGENYKLEGKEFMLGLTSGQPATSYTKDGRVGKTLGELFASVEIAAQYCKMKYLPYFHVGDANHVLSDEQLSDSAKNYLTHITKQF